MRADGPAHSPDGYSSRSQAGAADFPRIILAMDLRSRATLIEAGPEL